MVSRKSKFLNSDKNKNLQHQVSKGLGASGSVWGDCQKLDCVDRFQLHSLPDHTVLGNIFLSFRKYINKFNYLETTNNLGFPFLRSIFDRLFRKWFLSASAKLLKIKKYFDDYYYNLYKSWCSFVLFSNLKIQKFFSFSRLTFSGTT